MPLIENGKLVEDRFTRVADQDEAGQVPPLPASTPVLLSLDRYLKEADALANAYVEVGLIWPNNKPIAEIAPYLPRLALVALHFPTFRDGRAYSQARLLRERLGWKGPLRATGNVLRDQFLIMSRAGFDQIVPSKEADAQAFDDAMHSYTVFYQPTGDGRKSLLRARLGRAATRLEDQASKDRGAAA
ncbi:uncharacterized protein (DUF934 family) [Ancylobacter sp. 3268]|uniref:DUF934 domain-containing protein n=1 Tax=Ancylobacter sp. 3268 TaxID=2817752 RepID=UPI00285551D7|nr:DUF934 domain-containing protein [Ancylobacter sp. 3268]MDR6953864.1 uncharacterized protein (DUF934 family) [Ancylobacter sp. 3268]